MKDVRKQDEEAPAEEAEAPAEEESEAPAEGGGIEEKIDTIFKALADLQDAVKDLATAISAGNEAQRGLAETLNAVKSWIEKQVDVGVEAAAEANQEADDTAKLAEDEPEAVGEEVNVEDTSDVAEAPYEKGKPGKPAPRVVDVKKDAEAVGQTPKENEVIKKILAGELKPGEVLKYVKF